MSPRQRSLAGLALAVLLIPVLAGLLACLPVPIGNPERSRIDASLNGIWLWDDGVALFEPYDKRTWLVTTYKIRRNDCEEQYNVDVAQAGYADAITALREGGVDCLRGDFDISFKAWLTEIGGHDFMTWEPKGGYDKEYGFAPDIWYAFRMTRKSDAEFGLLMLVPEFEELAGADLAARIERLEDEIPNDPKLLKSTRRDVERLIRRNLDSESLYGEQYVFFRIKPEDHDMFVPRIVPNAERFDEQ